nr:PKD domain-containing protein [Microlunatus panaciterrae]
MGFLDTGLVPGSTHKYRVFAIDPFGNYARSDYVSVVVSEDGDISTYAQGVLDDKATNYWRLGEPSGDTVYDWAGYGDATVRSGVTRGADGAIIGDTNKAASFSANDNGLVSQSITQKGPDTFTTEAWIKTTTRKGGKIIGFGSNPTGDSSSYDRHVYMGNDGRINFGVYPGGVRLVTSPLSYNDGEWHHVVSSLSTSGMQLFVDGRRVANRTDTTTGQAYMGVWRIGGDNIGGWPNSPTSKYFDGVIDDVAVYPTALTATQIRKHYVDSGRSLAGSVAPADDYGKAVYNSEPDLYWRLNEATGTAAADSSPNFQAGTYNGGYTLGSPSGVGLSTDTSVTLDGTNGAVASNNTFVNPTTYSEELWFKTATTNGGKLIGFGNAQFGSSSGYDRHVYMLNSGQLRFGVWTGQTNVIDSPSSYNDDKWHHLVASQGADGMKLYVDDQLVGTNPQTGAQDYTGYWRVGGDNQWGDANSNYFAGSIDEVAVYSKVLTTAEIQDHFLKGGGTLPNAKPVAAFSFEVSDLSVAFDGSGSSDSDGSVASYAWDFGDGGSSDVAKPSHVFAAAGDYQVKLTVTDDKGATDSVTKTVTAVAPPANVKPVAAFSFEVSDLSVAFDGSGSSDSDGSVASYAWDFGDGGSSDVAKPSHVFAAAGDYQVKLTVTDDKGATDSVTKTVTAVAPPANVKPVAAFSFEVSDLSVAFDGSESSDSDGSVASYAWDFGDGGSSDVAKPSHVFAAAGDYQVKLTVTDDKGATDSVTKTVTAVAAPVGGPLAADAFGRSVTGGWGSADTGGAWTTSGSSTYYSVSGGVGHIRSPLAARGGAVTLKSVSSTDTDVSVTVSLDKVADGGGTYVSLGGRANDAGDYRAKVKVLSTGRVVLYLVKVVGSTETTLKSLNLPSSLTYVAGSPLQVRLQVAGTSPTTVQAKVWQGTEPSAWQLSTTDSTSGLQDPGGIALVTYVSGTTTNTPIDITFDNLSANAQDAPPPANVKPVAAFSFVVSDLSVAFDGSGSSDSDGSVASYAWDFGDGGSSDVAKPSHVFAAAGDYQVKLTVTDDKGATDSVTKTVTAVAAPVGGPLAADAFGRSVTGGWGSADTGGAWTTSGSSTYYSVSGGVGHIRSPLAARGGAVTLKSVSSTDTDVSVTVSLDKVADGGGTYVSLGGRANDAGDYRAKVKVLSTGRVVLYLVKVVGSTETTLKSLNLPSSLTYVAGSPLQVRLQVAGTSPTTVQAKVWQGTEPSAWQLSTTDSTSGLQDPGGIALVTYVSGTTTNTPIDITFDDLLAKGSQN